MDPALKEYLDAMRKDAAEIKASINSNGTVIASMAQQIEARSTQLTDLCGWKPDLEARFAKLQATVADLQRAQTTAAAATGGSVAADLATKPPSHGGAIHDSDVFEHGTCDDSKPSPTAELVTMLTRTAARPAPVTNIIIVAPVACSTEYPSSNANELMSASTPAAAPMSSTATIDVIPGLTAAAGSDGTFDDKSIKGAASMLTTSSSGSPHSGICALGSAFIPFAPPSLSSSWHQEHMQYHTRWPPPYLYLSWCDSSKARPIPWPSFDDLPAAVHLTEPWPPPQGTSGEFSVAVDVIYHFPDSLSWISPLHICLHYELDREESVISVRRTVDLEERFTSLGMSLNISEKNLKKTHTESIEVTVSDLIIGGASVFQQWRVPWISFLFLDLTSTEGYGLILFHWSTGWQLDEECSDYYQWHVALALSVSSTSKDSECVLAGGSPPECLLGVQYCHGNIFEGCPSVYMAMVMLLYRNYSPLNSWSGYTALQCTTALVVQICKLMYGNKRLAWGIISDVFLKCNQYVCCVDALKPWSLLVRMVHICWLLLHEQVSMGVAVLDTQQLRWFSISVFSVYNTLVPELGITEFQQPNLLCHHQSLVQLNYQVQDVGLESICKLSGKNTQAGLRLPDEDYLCYFLCWDSGGYTLFSLLALNRQMTMEKGRCSLISVSQPVQIPFLH